MRVKARWEALDEESTQIAYAKACGKMYHAPVFGSADCKIYGLNAQNGNLLWTVETSEPVLGAEIGRAHV